MASTTMASCKKQSGASANIWDFECYATAADELSLVSLICFGNDPKALNATAQILRGTSECGNMRTAQRNEYRSFVTAASSCNGAIHPRFDCTGIGTVELRRGGREFCTTRDVCHVSSDMTSCPVEYGGALLTTRIDAAVCPQHFSLDRVEGEVCMADSLCQSNVCVNGLCRSGFGCAGMDCERNSHCRTSLGCVNGFCA